MMKITVKQISEILHGTIVGDPEQEVNKLSKIEEGEKGSLTFLSNPKYTHYIYTTKASVAIVNNDFKSEKDISITLIKVTNAYQAFSKLLAFYNEIKLDKKGIEQPNFVSKTAQLGKDIYLGAFAYIGNNVMVGNNVKIYPNVYIADNVKIGDNTTLFSGSIVYSDCIIGTNCVVHSGVIIGADGFGFTPDENNRYQKVPQTGIAGSTKIGKNCMIGGQVGIAGHLIIGNNVKIQAQSGIGRNLKDGEVVQGSPALPYGDYNKSYVHFKNLNKLADRVHELEKIFKTIKAIDE